MAIGRRFLPERVNLRLAALFDDLRKPRRFDLEKLHSSGIRPTRRGGPEARATL